MISKELISLGWFTLGVVIGMFIVELKKSLSDTENGVKEKSQ